MSEYNIQMNKYNAINAGYDQLYPQPMKHANTHAKDGNDPITPSMIGTYNKTEIDTALQNKAPAGYGLGGQSKFISSSDDLNDAVYDGWYYFEAPPINAPLLDGVNAVGYSSMLVANRMPSLYVTQEIFVYSSWEAFNCVLRRCRINGEWKPWEWVDPPMMPGEEYRTTERYLGKPVYIKVVNFGAPPAGGDKIVEWGSSVYQPVSHRAIWTDTSGNTLLPYDDGDGLSIRVRAVTGLKIVINANYNWSSQGSISVTIKYTKTTD